MYNQGNPYGLDPSTVASGGIHGYGTDSGIGAGAPMTSSMPSWEKAGLAGAGGLGIGALSGMFGSDDESVSGGGNQYLSQIPDILKKYFAPYQQMEQDPTGKLKELGQGYTASPGYHFALQQALQGVGSAAASGGMAGSPMQQQQSAQTAQGLASQDYGNYMQRALGMYQTGAQGYSRLGEDLSSNLMSQAQYQQLQEEEAQRNKEQSSSDMWGSIGSIAGSAASMAAFL